MGKKLDNDEVDRRLEGREIKRLEPYTNGRKKIKFECMVCNNIWATTTKVVLRGHGCPECNSKKLDNDMVDFLLKNRNIERVGNYIGIDKRLEFKCLICNYHWENTSDLILNKHKKGCPQCNETILTNKIIDEKLKDRDIIRIGEYVNNYTKLDFKCLKCNHTWATKSTHIFSSETGCPACSLHKNEKLAYKILRYNNIKCEKQKLISQIISGEERRIFVDFYIESANTIIEVNGHQHFRPVCFGGCDISIAEANFIKQQARDQYLRELCQKHDITLLEIDGRQYVNSKLKKYMIETIIPMLKSI